MVSSSPRQSRLLSLSIYCAATLLLSLSSADAFSLVQNVAAASQQSDGTGGATHGPSPSASAASRRGGRPSSAAASSTAGAANPFRGKLNSRRQRQRGRHPRPSSRGGESSSDDFALRMSVEDHDDGSHESQLDHGGGSHHADAASTSSSSCSSNQKSLMDDSLTSSIDEETQLYERRTFLHGMLATTAVAAGFTAAAPEPANAYEQAYPLELQSTPYGDAETSSNSLSKLKEERLSNKKAKVAATKSELASDPLGLNQSPLSNNFGLTIAGASTWALALWFATGSRSNPVVTPLANVLYDEKEETWLADRNEGYFGELPLSFAAILSAVFVFLGVVLDRAVYFLADGDAEVSLQLAGVSVIGGAVWEVGRLAAKEKAPTREEWERDVLLYSEFDEFAAKRLLVGRGSCHRSDVIAAFRRYNPKYRDSESERYPLADIEIERILRKWNRERGSGNEMSSAGFFAGIVVDGAADAFAPR
mmetsp:Transcript_15697/g.33170  ORF Transcript_15697/g.33170 Transcript_15697/m.33170 type:complete len:478 (+) Transcript_15697:245-1678(+)|eukprot:CAMPEP_0196130572 /NCGR_PEP_ID=MMETSP0910-20130528/897_1 /TAXON_ID=49265 /ORGANISM="Thalassiosira rotula, Strain GSO102" /LENGTH=477 /DNA_ID=CAMNT_0041389909 /DNA_START=195 /DNA_END=1628 /DNA_ORIENTATION=-